MCIRDRFLAVPKEITVDAMLVHQRYFPLFNQDGTLANKFLITSNGDPAFRENIVDGNERVVAARLYDAKFFYDEDLKKPLEAYVEGLSEVVFQEALGTTLEKTKRVVKVARHLAAQAGLDAADAADAERAAYLCKADLVTGAVVEFTSVQGVMGSYYAAASGETPQVAQAIADHYRPRFSGDDLPASAVGKVVAMADKLDTICGLFAIGQGPTGSSDPFALRRAAIGIVSILFELSGVSLLSAIDVALERYAEAGIAFDRAAVRAAVMDFFVTRTKVMLLSLIHIFARWRCARRTARRASRRPAIPTSPTTTLQRSCTSWAGWRLAPRGNVRRAKRARAPKRLWRRLGS